MPMLLLDASTPLRLGDFTPFFVVGAIWLVAVLYGLFALRSHPKGLGVLFFTEMWERFSYYGMRALLILYMVRPVSEGGLGFSDKLAGIIYAFYTLFAYAMSVPGGFLADRFLGYRRAVTLGGILIALGEFSLATGPVPFFFGGLALITIGTGLLKTNCTSLVGMLYPENDPRQDAGYSVYYMGINIGALVAPLVLGFVAQKPAVTAALQHVGLTSPNGWRCAFALAGLAMVAGLVQYHLRQKTLGDVGMKPGAKVAEHGHVSPQEPLTREERSRMWVVGILVLFAMTFFFVFEQAGTTLNLFADRHTHTSILGFTFPSSWFQSVGSTWILILAPAFSWLWIALRHREPSSPVKFAMGIFFAGLGMLVLAFPSLAFESDPSVKAAPYWLITTFGLHTMGELCLSPVGLSTMKKLAPARYAGLLMGVWFFATGLGNFLAGLAGSISSSVKGSTLFISLFAITSIMALALLLLTPRIKRMMGGVN